MITIHAATASESLNKDSEAQTHGANVVTRLSEALPSDPKARGHSDGNHSLEMEVNFHLPLQSISSWTLS